MLWVRLSLASGLSIQMDKLWFFAAAVLTSCTLTGFLRRYALARSLIDIPNARSSHSLPTPRGGGVAIVITFLGALVVAFCSGELPYDTSVGLLVAGGIVAVVGFLDDHGHIAARWRLLVHFLCAGLGLWCIGGVGPLAIGPLVIEPSWMRNALGVLFLVWMINLYNFMDGIDGLASVEALTSCLSIFFLLFLGDSQLSGLAPLLLAASALGFLIWNFPRAKIFMGDAGSGFLGLALGFLAIQSSWQDPVYFWAWCILLGVFVVDASYTLISRLLRGEKVYEAHRSHAYQYASRSVGAHFPVTVTICLINLAWLLPIAAAVVLHRLDAVLGVVIAYVPLIWLAVYFKAGTRD